jgi:hypothetical protein
MLVFIVLVGFVFLAAERRWPDQQLTAAPGWWLRATLGNLGQLGVVLLAGLSWD